MKISLVVIGKTDNKNTSAIVEDYLARINRYIDCRMVVIPDVKRTMSAELQKQAEATALLKYLKSDDYLVLLDENGTQFTSREFSVYLNKRMVSACKNLVFVVGGPYGFAEQIYALARDKISLSAMTFSHQMVRAIFTEQLYRAFSILNNEPYHHD